MRICSRLFRSLVEGRVVYMSKQSPTINAQGRVVYGAEGPGGIPGRATDRNVRKNTTAQHIAFLANHGKPWDCKVMGTKVSYPRKGDLCQNPAKEFSRCEAKQVYGACFGDLCQPGCWKKTAPRPKGRSAKLSGAKARCARQASQPPDH